MSKDNNEKELTQLTAQEQVQQIPVRDLHPFEGHPFRVVDDDEMTKMMESISQFGVIAPLLARPDGYGGYEIISGHRRQRAAELIGLETLPVIVREMDDDAAIIAMVDANLQREYILPSERAWAYKMKLDAMKHQGQRQKSTCAQVGHKLQNPKSVAVIAEDAGTSKTQVQRYIRLTELIPELSEMVDKKKVAMNPAVELSYLPRRFQRQLLDAMEYAQATPSLSQAQRLKKLSQAGHLDQESMQEIMNEEKKDPLERVIFSADSLRKYFPKSYTPKQMEGTILKLLEQWQKKRGKKLEQDRE